MPSSLRGRIVGVMVLAIVACAGAILALFYLARTSTEQRSERAREAAEIEVERLEDLGASFPKEDRGKLGKRGMGPLRSGFVDDAARLDRSNPRVAAVIRGSRDRGSLYSEQFEVGKDGAVVMAAAPVEGGGFAWAAIRVPGGRENTTLRGAVLVLALVMLLLVAASIHTLKVFERGARSLRDFVDALAMDLSAPAPRPAIRELSDVAGGLATLASGLQTAEKERQRLTEELASRERLAALGRVVAGVAHEVRNPLAAIKLRADLAQAGGDTPPAIARDLADISSEVARLDRLVSDLLVVAGRRAGPRTREDAGVLAKKRALLLAPWARERGVQIEVTGSAETAVDVDAVSRALDNLLRNAVEASARGGKVVVDVAAEGERAVVAISDEGPGIALARRAELFEPFFTTKPEGTGLGLALSRAVASSHDGTLTYERSGDRTRFILSLPLAGV